LLKAAPQLAAHHVAEPCRQGLKFVTILKARCELGRWSGTTAVIGFLCEIEGRGAVLLTGSPEGLTPGACVMERKEVECL
jgi:hypothetical protein